MCVVYNSPKHNPGGRPTQPAYWMGISAARITIYGSHKRAQTSRGVNKNISNRSKYSTLNASARRQAVTTVML